MDSVLVINCGSTSIKMAVIEAISGRRAGQLQVERLGTEQAQATLGERSPEPAPAGHREAIEQWLPRLVEHSEARVGGVGHRVVHGGPEFRGPTLVDEAVMERLRETVALAPLHNPAGVAGIEAAREQLPDVPHVAVFDTSFHAQLPARAATYAIPPEVAERFGVRRYGFHGTSHRFVAHQAARYLDQDPRSLRIISCHLGGGCSVCAVEYGRSVETSMGMTPLEGLVMATRCGDLDPAVMLRLLREGEYTVDQVDEMLNQQSGLKGLSQASSDYRDIEQRAQQGDERCRLAIDVFCHRVRKYIGAYAAVMGGVDAIVFTAGIGQNSPSVRHHVTQRLDFLGARLDETANRDAEVSSEQLVADVSAPQSRVKLLVAKTDEAWEIARCTQQLCQARSRPDSSRSIPIAISARHVHLTQETVEALFGEGHRLTEDKPLNQPGQFAAREEVTLVGPKQRIEGVRVLGPTRDHDQVEISRTDEFRLGIDAPVRPSGEIENTPGITLVGTEGRQVTLGRGVICAWRHIHMSPEDAEAFGVEDGDQVEVDVGDDRGRRLTFGDVLIRVQPQYRLEMHLDTDEGNAAELDHRDVGRLETEPPLRPADVAARVKRVGEA